MKIIYYNGKCTLFFFKNKNQNLVQPADTERNTGIYRLLSSPLIYDTYQKLVGGKNCRRKVVQEYGPQITDAKILDIGCGTGYVLDYLPEDIDYTGYDLSEDYIQKAKRKYGHRARFFCQRVSHLNLEEAGTYDFVLATGVVHHLNDSEAKSLYQLGFEALKPGGKMVTEDGTFIPNQNKFAKFIIKNDRGLHIRQPQQYEALSRTSFEKVVATVRHDLFFIPFTSCVLESYKL